MKRVTAAMLVGAVAALVSVSQARAQYIFLGGGLSIPVSDFKAYAKSGWLATGGVGVDIGDKGLWVEAEGYYGSNKHKAPDTGDKTNILAGFAALGYSFTPDAKVSPYVVGGVGFLRHQFDPAVGNNSAETKFAYNGGVGIGYNASSSIHLWVEGRFMGASSTKLIPINAGISIQLGKKKM
jgi:opacity protein-like surface antigen